MSQAGGSGTARNFITLLRMAHNFKLLSLFLEVST